MAGVELGLGWRAVPGGWARLLSPRLALVLGLATVGLVLVAVPLALTSGAQSSGLPMVPFAAVGWVVAARQPRNPIGWILLALSLVFLLASDAGQYAVLAFHQGYRLPLARAAVFVAGWWIWLVLLLPLPVGLFPDGRLTRRWRPVLWAYAVFCLLLVAVLTWRDAAGIGANPIRIDATGELVSVGNASGLAAPLYGLILAFCAVWVLRPLARFRGSSGEYRQQLKWLLAGGVIALLGLVVTLAGQSFAFIFILALPIGMGVGILKYRLYEIDRLISRAISYLIVTGLLAALFFAIVLLTTRILPVSSPIATAASTLAAAALFNPLRRRVQRLVDRRFNRTRYDADAIVTTLAACLRNAVDADTVQTGLLTAVSEAFAPTHASVWISTTTRPAPPP